ncbi:MAG: NAD(P)H-dependent oxidoreductase [Gemmatimonadaceae bacterium]|nr:NAD(P)H-dependent oxidoreductase [Caulobacter sp.]
MSHAVILAHPNPRSFNAAMASAYVEDLKAMGQEVILRDLYALRFDPCLKASEIPGPSAFTPEPDVLAERALLAKAEVFVFVYPFWFNAPPAILKGYVDRVFSMGFGYEPDVGGTRPGLSGRRLLSFSSSGAPDAWVRSTGALANLQTVFDHHLAAVCGMSVLDHIHFGAIVADITPEAVGTCLDQVRATAREHFATPR